MQRFTEIKAWQRAHDLVLDVYRVTKSFPADERFGIISQIRRAAVSVPTNIAEGAKRDSNAEYSRFLNIAEASMAETEYLLMLSRDLGFLDANAADRLLSESNEVSSMLAKLRARVSETLNSQL